MGFNNHISNYNKNEIHLHNQNSKLSISAQKRCVTPELIMPPGGKTTFA